MNNLKIRCILEKILQTRVDNGKNFAKSVDLALINGNILHGIRFLDNTEYRYIISDSQTHQWSFERFLSLLIIDKLIISFLTTKLNNNERTESYTKVWFLCSKTKKPL